MLINDFIKEIKKTFSNVEYRATSKDGQVFKSQGWDKANENIERKRKRK